MSKVGKQPIILKDGVTVTKDGRDITVKGPKGAISVRELSYTRVEIAEKEVTVVMEKDIKQGRSNWGTMQSLLDNAVTGVMDGFSKKLEINGVGYKVALDGRDLVLSLGFSHPVRFVTPENITIEVEKNTMTIKGFDKDQVGRTAATIRALKKPEPYKGKGIKYTDEIIIRKAGKKVVG